MLGWELGKEEWFMKSKKGMSVLTQEARKKRRKKKLKIAWIVSLFLICGGIIVGSFYYFGREKTSYAADDWEATDLTQMVAPTLTDSTKNFTITTARTTFYDVYSDSQVWDWSTGNYRSSVGEITDGNMTASANDGNTFTHFNYTLSLSTNKNGLEYQHMYEARTTASSGVYPLYCGIFWPVSGNNTGNAGQTEASRWGTWTKDSRYNGITHGYWFAAANCNQKDNGSTKVDKHGVAGSALGGAAQGLVNSTLDEDGNITIGHGDDERVLPYFDEEYLNEAYAAGKVTHGQVVSNIAFPFRQGDGNSTVYLSSTTGETTDENYYYFDSYSDVIQLNEASKNVTYYYKAQQVTDTDGFNGFFPYNVAADGNSKKLNYVFGTKMELNFNMTSDGKIKGNDIIFEFNGDDDLWVFVDGYLVLDIGGAHIPVHGSINFADKKAVVDVVKKDDAFSSTYRDSNYGTWEYNKTYNFSKTNQTDENAKKLYELLSDTNINHKLTIFYMERGKANSNLKIKFNLPQITTMSVGNEIDTDNVNDALKTKSFWEACNSHYFKYDISNMGTNSLDINNALDITGQAATNWQRINLPAIGLSEKLRKKITSTDGAALRYRFFTFTGTNYYSMVMPNTEVGYVDMNKFASKDTNGNYIAKIDGEEYVFQGWTTDKNYYDHWNEIKAGTYTGEIPKLVTANSFLAKESQDYYAVWAKKEVKITYCDQPNVDTPEFGYDSDQTVIGTNTITTTSATGTFVLPTDSDSMVADWESADEHRKGYRLVGWQLEPTDPDNDVDIETYTSFSTTPLCDMTLYAKWEKVQTRCIFTVTEDVENIRDASGNDVAASDSTWTSNIVYFDIGTKVRFPYIDDTYQTENISGMFTSLPIRDCYGITAWTTVVPSGVDDDPKTYNAGNSGTRWTVPDTDTEFTGTWEKVYSKITFDASYGDDKTWDTKTVKYAVGETIRSKPEVDAIWSDGNVPEIELYKVIGWHDAEGEITFPYKVTEQDESWKADWSKAYCKVTYQFNTDNNINCNGTNSYTQYFDVGSNIQTPGLESFRGNAPKDSNGTEEIDGSPITYYMTGNDGKAYVISGWTYKDTGKTVSNNDVVDDTTVCAVWKEATTSVTFHVFVEGNNNNADDSEWDETKAEEAGWTWNWAASGNAAKDWKITLECTPGKSYQNYADRDTGEYKDKLYVADIQSDQCLYDMNDIDGWAWSYGGTEDAVSEKITYTANSHSAHLYAIWGKKKNTVRFIASDPTGSDGNDLWNGVLTYSISKKTLTADEMPKIGGVIYNSETKEKIELTEQSGFELTGWVLPNTNETLQEWEIQDEGVLYALWSEKTESTDTESTDIGTNSLSLTDDEDTTNGSDITTQSIKKTSLLSLFAFTGSTGTYASVSDTWYQLNDAHMVEGDGNGIGKTDSSGAFYLQYDQIASFLNCFSSPSNMQLKENLALYEKTESGTYVENVTKKYNDMYNTTWELRDLHDFITDRTKSGSENLEKMPIGEGDDGVYIYDGRVIDDSTGMFDTKAFKFQNENEATGTSYATNVRAIFTHEVKTGELSITKNMTDFAQENMDTKKDNEREFTFYVYFYNLFGGSGDSSIDDEKVLYNGEYIKLDASGKIIKDSDGNAVTYMAEDGRILIKAGETALIKGIPVLTKYQIEEESMELARRAYVMSSAKEVVTGGLGSENTKYIIKDKESTSVDIVARDSAVCEIGNENITNKNSDADIEISGQITGQIGKAGQTYNYIVENDISIVGVQINIEKLIDRFYYAPDEEFLEDQTYQEKTGAEQSFVFDIKCTPIDDSGNANTAETTTVQQVISFSPDDEEMTSQRLQSTGRKGWKKATIIYGKAGYYEVTEDTAWSWKYNLSRIELSDAKKWTSPGDDGIVFDGTDSNTVCRFYIPPRDDETGAVPVGQPEVGSTVTWNGQKYRVLMSNPVITFENTITTDDRSEIRGDTDIVINEIAKQIITPTPRPTAKPTDQYVNVMMLNSLDGEILQAGKTYTLPTIVGEKKDGSTEVISDITWTSSNISACTISGNTLTAKTAIEGDITFTASYQDVVTKWPIEMTVKGVHNVVTIYYANPNAWPSVSIRYHIGSDGAWTTVLMERTDEKSGYYWKYVKDLGTQTNVEACFTNGSNVWDNHNGLNYQIDTSSNGYVVGIKADGSIEKMD